MSVESTRQALMSYLDAEHSGADVIAENVVFTEMGTGQEFNGREGALQMLHYFYSVAFQATAELKNMVVDDGKAICEYDFVGKHTGEFAGVPPTGVEVHVPLCVAYDFEADKIVRARVYFEIPAFLRQVGSIS